MRYLIPAGLAIAVTCAVFFGMQHLIADPDGELGEPSPRATIEMVRVRHETPAQPKPRTLPHKPEMAAEPPPPAVQMAAPGAPGAVAAAGVDVTTPEADLDIKVEPGIDRAAVGEADATPMVRVEPTMPRKAMIEQVEGVVLVRFDIGPTGSTADVQIVHERPLGFGFGDAARKAVQRWRYRPRVVDGAPVIQKGVQVRLRFAHRR